MSTETQKILEQIQTIKSLDVVGGNAQYVNNIQDYNQYKLWVEGVDSNPVLCSFGGKNSLKPIWEFATQERKNELKLAFDRLCEYYPLPAYIIESFEESSDVFFVKNKKDDNYWNIPGVHFDALEKGDVQMSTLDDWEPNGLQGMDRFIKIIPQPNDKKHVMFQPQHSKNVFIVSHHSLDAGIKIHLFDKNTNSDSKLFRMIPVDDEESTYYIQNKRSELFLTSNGPKKTITQEKECIKDNCDDQKWIFEKEESPALKMAPPPEGLFAFKNSAKDGLFWGFAGRGTNWPYRLRIQPLNNTPDKFFSLKRFGDKNQFTIKSFHTGKNLNLENHSADAGNKIDLIDETNSSPQLFQFEYAGEPRTFYIKNQNRYLNSSTPFSPYSFIDIQDKKPMSSNQK